VGGCVLWVPVQSLVNRIHLHWTWQKRPVDISRMTVIHIRRMRQRGMREWDWETVLKMTRKIVGGRRREGSVRSWRRMTQRNRAST